MLSLQSLDSNWRVTLSRQGSSWFNDAAVRGDDPIETRPGVAALLDRIEGNGVRTVIVEDASRFAREFHLTPPSSLGSSSFVMLLGDAPWSRGVLQALFTNVRRAELTAD